MSGIDRIFSDFGRLDRLARQQTPVHRLDPRAKLIPTAIFLFCVVSFGKYEVAALLPFFIYPVALAALGRIPLSYVGGRVLAVAPFAVMVGIFNPLLDREIMLQLGGVAISGGWVSFVSILLRFCLTIGTAVVLIGVTSFDGLCLGLQRLAVPRVFTVQLLVLYRYIFVLGDEAVRLVRARSLRTFGRRGLGLRNYGSMVGHLLIRTLERARRIHLAMRCRGFTGEIHSTRQLRFGRPEVVFAAGWTMAFIALRQWNLPLLLEQALKRIGQ
jgi:cobalt/nickel transport system permease protein